MHDSFKEALWAFLFKPEALSIYFLVVMAAIFFYGVFRVIRFVTQIKRELDSIRKEYANGDAKYKVDPMSFIKLHQDDEYMGKKVAIIPGVLVSVGILGTFVGLGVAIKLASTSMTNLDMATDSLNELLNTVAFKFQTSAWGVLSSIVFSAIFGSIYHKEKEKMYEASAREMMHMYKPASVALRDILNRTLGSLTDKMGQSVLGLSNSTSAFQNTISEFKNEVTGNVMEMTTYTQNMGNIGNSLNSSIARMGESLTSTISSQISEMNNATTSAIGTLSQNMDRTVDVVQSLQTSMEGIKKEIGDVLENMGTKIDANLQNSSEYTNRLTTHMGQLSKTMNRSVDQMGTLVSLIEEWEAKKASAELNEMSKPSSSDLKGMKDVLGK